MPEATNNSGRHLNVCILNHQFFNHKLYSKMLDKGSITPPSRIAFDRDNDDHKEILFESMNISQRFKLRYDARYLQFAIPPEEYILGDWYCYQIYNQPLYHFPLTVLANVSRIKLSLSDKLPNVDFTRFTSVDDITTDAHESITLSSYYYFVLRLPWPYVDDCFDYNEINFASRVQAVGDCFYLDRKHSRESYEDRVTWSTIVRRSDIEFANFTAFGDIGSLSFEQLNEHCSELGLYEKFDCEQSTYFIEFNRTSIPTTSNSKSMFIRTLQNRNPSFDIESKPRIDHIDFVTYILGAMGSWFGFSFLILNPVPIFFGIRGNAVNDENVNEQLTRMRNRIAVCETEKHSDRIKYSTEINELKESKRVIEERIQVIENTLTGKN